MLIHIQPRFFTCERSGPDVALIDVRVPELDLTLQAGTDLVARRPYKNPRYLVAMRKGGRKAIEGLLIEAPGHLATFTVETRWGVRADTVALHRVTHHVLDAEFDAVSDHMLLWYAMAEQGWTRRWPDCYANVPPVRVQPRMTLMQHGDERHTPAVYRQPQPGVIEQSETLYQHTIEPHRLTPSRYLDRLPAADTAFRVGAAPDRRLAARPMPCPPDRIPPASSPTDLPTPIPLPSGVVAKIELTPMPTPGPDGRYPPSTCTAVRLHLFRGDVLLERRDWHTVICGAPAVTLADGTTLDADDLDTLDAAGWDQLLHYGVMPGALVD